MIAAAMPGPLADDHSAQAPAAAREFEAIYREHVGFVWRNLRRLGVPELEIEDAAHEVFMVVLRRLSEFDGKAAITTWLYAIVRGIASNRRRADLRRQRRLAVSPERLGPLLDTPPTQSALITSALKLEADRDPTLLVLQRKPDRYFATVRGPEVTVVAKRRGRD